MRLHRELFHVLKSFHFWYSFHDSRSWRPYKSVYEWRRVYFIERTAHVFPAPWLVISVRLVVVADFAQVSHFSGDFTEKLPGGRTTALVDSPPVP